MKLKSKYTFIFLLGPVYCIKSQTNQFSKKPFRNTQQIQAHKNIKVGVLAVLGCLMTMGACYFVSIHYNSAKKPSHSFSSSEQEEKVSGSSFKSFSTTTTFSSESDNQHESKKTHEMLKGEHESPKSGEQTNKDPSEENITSSNIADKIGNFQGMSTDFIVKCIKDQKSAEYIQQEITKDLQACFTDKVINFLKDMTGSDDYMIDWDRLKEHPKYSLDRSIICNQIKYCVDIFKDQIPEIIWMESVCDIILVHTHHNGLQFFKEIYQVTDAHYKEVIKNAIKQIYWSDNAFAKINKDFIIEFITKQKSIDSIEKEMQIKALTMFDDKNFLKELGISAYEKSGIYHNGIKCLKEIKKSQGDSSAKIELWQAIENALRALVNDINDPVVDNLGNITNTMSITEKMKITGELLNNLQNCHPMFKEKSIYQIKEILNELKELGFENYEIKNALDICDMITSYSPDKAKLDKIGSLSTQITEAVTKVKDRVGEIKMPVSLKKAVCDLIAKNQVFGDLKNTMAKIIRDCLPEFKVLELTIIKLTVISLKTSSQDAGIIAILKKIEEYFALYKALDNNKQGISGIHLQSYIIKNNECFQILKDVLDEIIRDAKQPSLIDRAFAEDLINGKKTVGDVIEQFNVMKCICSESALHSGVDPNNLYNVVSKLNSFIGYTDTANKDKFRKLLNFASIYLKTHKIYKLSLRDKGRTLVNREGESLKPYFSKAAISAFSAKLSSIEKTSYEKLTKELIEIYENFYFLTDDHSLNRLWNSIFVDVDIRTVFTVRGSSYGFFKENIGMPLSDLKAQIRRKYGLSNGRDFFQFFNNFFGSSGFSSSFDSDNENFFHDDNRQDSSQSGRQNSSQSSQGNPFTNPTQPPKFKRPPEIVAALEEACDNIGKIDKLAGEVIKEIGVDKLKENWLNVKGKIIAKWKEKEVEIWNVSAAGADMSSEKSKMYGTNVENDYALCLRGIRLWFAKGKEIHFSCGNYSYGDGCCDNYRYDFLKAMPNLVYIQNAI